MSYYHPDLDIDWLTSGFEPISLDKLNAKAEMLDRIDWKYVTGRSELEPILSELQDSFDILDISGRRAFLYETRYFDDPSLSAYFEHHQGRRKRCKVRVRRYADGGPCFLEVKVKGPRGATLKRRTAYDPRHMGRLTPDGLHYARSVYCDQYGKDLEGDLIPVLDVRYHRMTLVAKSGGERMTIDARLQFRNGRNKRDASNDMFVLETKSRYGRAIADKLLRGVGLSPTQKCSKYCMGLAALDEVERFNMFLPAMRELGLADMPDMNIPGVQVF